MSITVGGSIVVGRQEFEAGISLVSGTGITFTRAGNRVAVTNTGGGGSGVGGVAGGGITVTSGTVSFVPGVGISLSGVGSTITITNTSPVTGSAGVALLDFGAFPGASDASLAITAQTGILAGSTVLAWLQPAATVDHSADEHLIESLRVMAGNIVAGTGFTIYGANASQVNEPLETVGVSRFGAAPSQYGYVAPSRGGAGTRIYGKWNVGWMWK